MRPPVIAGIAAGAGATTVAAALHGVDGGCWTGGPVDVLVIGPHHDLAELPAGIPVLVVRAAGPAAAAPATRHGAVVVLPDVPGWRGPDGPRAAAGLLRLAERERPAALRAAVDALLAVTAALLDGGVLDRPLAPPRPVRRAVVVRPPDLARMPVVLRGPARAAPVVVQRAAPVVPRLVAGRPLRVSAPSGTPFGAGPERPSDAASPSTRPDPPRRTLRLAPAPVSAVPARTGEPDDDTVEAGLDGERRRLPILRTG